MQYKFIAHGHPNILGTHKATFEFTKDKTLSLRGDCIIGVAADFELGKLKDFIKKSKNKSIAIKIQAVSENKKIHDTISAQINPDFNDDCEFVVRKTDFLSERTFAVKSDKSALELDRSLIEFLSHDGNKIEVILETREL